MKMFNNLTKKLINIDGYQITTFQIHENEHFIKIVDLAILFKDCSRDTILEYINKDDMGLIREHSYYYTCLRSSGLKNLIFKIIKHHTLCESDKVKIEALKSIFDIIC